MAMRGQIGAAVILALIAGGPPAGGHAQNAPADAANAPARDENLSASVAKMNAYVALLNRSLRAVQSLDRYKSWVNMKTGPTGRESIVYGLYQVYDTTKEAESAAAALTRQPLLPELDAAMRSWVLGD